MVRTASGASDPESGSASVLAVSGVGILAVVAMLALGGRAVVERRAVEDSIAEMRAYWAAMGHATYALSRVKYDGANGGADQKPQDLANQAAKEIADGNGGKGANLNATWRYPDVSANYIITVAPSPAAPDASVGPGAVKLSFDFTSCTSTGPNGANANLPQALRTIKALRGLAFEYCVVSPTSASCSNPSSLPAAPANWYAQRIVGVQRSQFANKPC